MGEGVNNVGDALVGARCKESVIEDCFVHLVFVFEVFLVSLTSLLN